MNRPCSLNTYLFFKTNFIKCLSLCVRKVKKKSKLRIIDNAYKIFQTSFFKRRVFEQIISISNIKLLKNAKCFLF